jgi:regulatory protein
VPTSSDDPVDRAVKSALRLLKARSRTRQEIDAALERKDFPADARASALEKLTGWGYLDDVRFARERARTLLSGGGRLGPDAARRRLEAHGLSAALAREAISQAQTELGVNPLEAARSVLAKRRYAPPFDRKTRAKAARLLSSRGFDEGVIETLLGDPSLDSAPEDE